MSIWNKIFDSINDDLISFLLEKACCEVNYELDNRPEWLKIPLQSTAELFHGPEGGA